MNGYLLDTRVVRWWLADLDRLSVPAVADLPLRHQDPFDRIPIAQAQRENLTLVTRDSRRKQNGNSVQSA